MSTHRCASQTHSPVRMFYARKFRHFLRRFFSHFFAARLLPVRLRFPYLDPQLFISCSFQFNGDIHFFVFASSQWSTHTLTRAFFCHFLVALASVDFRRREYFCSFYSDRAALPVRYKRIAPTRTFSISFTHEPNASRPWDRLSYPVSFPVPVVCRHSLVVYYDYDFLSASLRLPLAPAFDLSISLYPIQSSEYNCIAFLIVNCSLTLHDAVRCAARVFLCVSTLPSDPTTWKMQKSLEHARRTHTHTDWTRWRREFELSLRCIYLHYDCLSHRP